MREKISIIGKKFGMLTPVGRVEVPNKSGIFYLCKCDCGNEKVISKSSITSNRTVACGCLIGTTRGLKIRDLAGQRFGKLVAISLNDERCTRGKAVWKCKCDCGNTIDVTSSQLVQRGTKSCGCWRREAPKKRSKGKYDSDWRWESPRGYVYLYKPNHPNSGKHNGQVAEHVYVMSEYLKRPLKKGESVHHKNGIRNDNRIENLELKKGAHGPGQKSEDMVEFAKEILKTYAPELLK